MDFRSVTGLTIPAGNVNKISIGGVVYWKKSSGKYKIMKDGVQLARVKMSDLVSQVNSGAAQEDYGIGAQIIVPYHDPFNDNNYELPFNFGTFTVFGKGKLGLQTHYAIPSLLLTYTNSSGASYSYWLNSYKEITTHTINGVLTPKGFLGCLPEDFVECMCITPNNVNSQKVFILGIKELCFSTEQYYQNCATYMPFNITGDVWEYWQNKVGEPPVLWTGNEHYKVYLLHDKTSFSGIVTSTYVMLQQSSNSGFSTTGKVYTLTYNNSFPLEETSHFYYLPVCVIG